MILKLSHLKEIWGNPNSLGSQNLNAFLGPVCIDSREFKQGSFFIPLKGDNFDGHSFIQRVYDLGAQATVVSRTCKINIPSGFLHWVVDDTLQAYQELALLHRLNLDIPVIAVTGSAGKTTTKELIKACLGPLGQIVGSYSNNNNDIGVPLTLLTANSSHRAIVVEMGMRGLGEIKRLSYCSNPDIAVITNIGTAHIGRLGSRQNIAKAKCEITSSLKPTGSVVIPAGDPLLESELKRVWDGRVIRVALENDLSLSNYRRDNSISITNTRANLIGEVSNEDGTLLMKKQKFKLPFKGIHNATNFLLALAVANEFGVSFEKLSQLNVELPTGRHKLIQIGQITVIDETYNASPDAVKVALDLLVEKSGRHFAVLGTMLELGAESILLHRSIAEYAIRLGLDGLVIVADGALAEAMAEITSSSTLIEIVSTPEEAINPLRTWLSPGDILLLKGSRAIELERLIPLLSKINH